MCIRDRYKVDRFVVGLPKNMNNTSGPRVEASQAYGAMIAEKFGSVSYTHLDVYKRQQTTLPLKENRLYYDRESQDFKLRPEVADPQRPLTDEVTADSTSQENPAEKPTSAIKFAERKTAVYDELDLSLIHIYIERKGQFLLRRIPWLRGRSHNRCGGLSSSRRI